MDSERIKTLYSPEDGLVLWIQYVSKNKYKLNLTEPIQNIIYNIADYDDGRYTIYHRNYFNDIYIKLCRDENIKPSISTMIKTFMAEQEIIGDDLKMFKRQIRCFKRRVNIYITKKFRKARRTIWK